MAVEKVGERYICDICGNEVTVDKAGGGTLVCCGQDMDKIDKGEHTSTAANMPDSGG
jgi:superoxide reductase